MGERTSGAAFGDDAIIFTEHDHAWPPGFGLRFIEVGEVHDREEIARFSEMRRRPVKHDRARTGFAWNDVGLEAFAVSDVATKDSFKGDEADLLHQINGDRQAAFIVTTGIGHHGPVDFRFK
jgi:hypothetical protein